MATTTTLPPPLTVHEALIQLTTSGAERVDNVGFVCKPRQPPPPSSTSDSDLLWEAAAAAPANVSANVHADALAQWRANSDNWYRPEPWLMIRDLVFLSRVVDVVTSVQRPVAGSAWSVHFVDTFGGHVEVKLPDQATTVEFEGTSGGLPTIYMPFVAIYFTGCAGATLAARGSMLRDDLRFAYVKDHPLVTFTVLDHSDQLISVDRTNKLSVA